LGFSGAQNVLIRPVGINYPTAQNGTALVNFDISSYQFSLDNSVQLPLNITAELLYQTSSKEYVEFLRDAAVDNNTPTENNLCNRNWDEGPANKSRGRFMYDQWLQNGRSTPVIMASSTVSTAAKSGYKNTIESN